MKRAKPVRLFVSYSHVDRDWFGKLRPLLVFRGVEPIHVWHDQELKAGDLWDDEIRGDRRRENPSLAASQKIARREEVDGERQDRDAVGEIEQVGLGGGEDADDVGDRLFE